MSTFTKLPLSGSTNGKQIIVSAVSSGSANNIHTAVGGVNGLDEIWLYAYNDATASLSCSILWGGTTEPNDVNRFSLGVQTGRVLIVDGKLLQNGLTVQAYAEKANYICLDGFVNRVT